MMILPSEGVKGAIRSIVGRGIFFKPQGNPSPQKRGESAAFDPEPPDVDFDGLMRARYGGGGRDGGEGGSPSVPVPPAAFPSAGDWTPPPSPPRRSLVKGSGVPALGWLSQYRPSVGFGGQRECRTTCGPSCAGRPTIGFFVMRMRKKGPHFCFGEGEGGVARFEDHFTSGLSKFTP